MDTHISLQIRNNGKFKTYVLDDDIAESILFTIDEYNDCSFEINSEIKDIEIFIDTYEQEKFKCAIDKKYILNVHSPELNLIPGIYMIECNLENKKTIFYYEVKTQNIDSEQYNYMKEYINNLFEGIIFDYRITKHVSNDKLDTNVFSDYEKQYENWQKLRQEIDYILLNPAYELRKEYDYSLKIEKFDSKVCRYIDTKNNRNDKYIQPKVKRVLENSDNAILYVALEDYFNKINNNIKKINNNIELLKAERHEFQELLEEKEKEFNRIRYRNMIYSNNYIESVSSRQRYLKGQILLVENKIDRIEKTKELVEDLKKQVHQKILDFSELIYIKDINKYCSYTIRDMRYRNIIQNLYVPEYNIDGHEKKNKPQIGFSFKKTQLLFEYYSFLQVINIVTSLGFRNTDGWIKTVEEEGYIMDIPSECASCFKKDNIELVILYDKEVPYELVNGYVGMFSSNSKHRRPDIMIMLYINGEFKKTLICEVKYRNTKYIYDNFGDTEVVATMKDYCQLWYYDTIKGHKNRSAVSNVLVLYPNKGKVINYDNFMLKEEMRFIPLEIRKDIIEEQLFEEISMFLDV